jgi:hypothetical protein
MERSMLIGVLALITLVLYAVVVSQPFFYALALGRASNALGAGSYVELRQRINAAIAGPLVRVYAAAFAAASALAAVAAASGAWSTALGGATGAIGLVLDLVIAVRRNVPINRRMDGWTSTTIPDDWMDHRSRWSAALTLRGWLLGACFLALVAGIVLPNE